MTDTGADAGSDGRAHRWAGAWAELLRCEGQRVLLLEMRPSRARARLADQAAALGVLELDDGGRFVATEQDPTVLAAPIDEHLGELWDTVVVDAPPSVHAPDALAGAVAPGGRLVYVCANARSPLRRDDAPASTSWGRLSRALAGAGWQVEQRFGLLRSATVSTTAFDLEAPAATDAVLRAALVHLTGVRAAGVRVLRHLPKELVARVVPGWLVVARRPQDVLSPARTRTATAAAPGGDDLPVTGRMGYERTPDSKVLLGEPPAALERTYADPDGADAEATALELMGAARPGLAPALLARPRTGTLRSGWVQGRGLGVRTMPTSALVQWTGRAAETLRTIQEATLRDDGSVLVHGDFWLGNLLVSADESIAIIDWGEARWGDPLVDRRFLVDGLDGFRSITPQLRAELLGAVERAFAGFADGSGRP